MLLNTMQHGCEGHVLWSVKDRAQGEKNQAITNISNNLFTLGCI